MLKRLSFATLNYGIGQVIPKVVGFLLIPIYTAYLTPNDFGVVDLSLTVGSFLLSVIRLGIPGAISRFYFDHKNTEDEKTYISTLYFGMIVISIVLSIPFLIVAYFYIDSIVPGLPFYPFFIFTLLSALLNTSSDIQGDYFRYESSLPIMQN